MASSFCDTMFKILLLGDTNVGKTCFLLRYVEDIYNENHLSTVGVDYKTKLISFSEIPDEFIKLQIWDTAGQDRFRCITKNYYRGSNGIMLVYDITSWSSFLNIKNWITQIKDYLGDSACITLVANKIDLESNRMVSREEGLRLANEHNFSFFEASAKQNVSVNEAFENIARGMIRKDKEISDVDRQRMQSVKISKKTRNLISNSKKKCC
jgi:small GTP-binding protein